MDAVVALYADGGIGRDGTQPVALAADRKHFRELTEGAAVIVGRKTLEDFPGGRPLKNRYNIVLTRQELTIPGAEVVHSPEEALRAAEGHERCFVIGGASVYRALWPYIDRIHATHIQCAPESDSFFPDLDADPAWRRTEEGPWQAEDGIEYRFCTYEKR